MNNIALTEGAIFTGKHFDGIIEVESIDEANNIVNVKLTADGSFWREEFDLANLKESFDNGYYQIV